MLRLYVASLAFIRAFRGGLPVAAHVGDYPLYLSTGDTDEK
jgi:hypothetical protein